MLEAQDLQAITQVMLQAMEQQKQGIVQEIKGFVAEEIAASEQRMTQRITAMVDEKIAASEQRKSGRESWWDRVSSGGWVLGVAQSIE